MKGNNNEKRSRRDKVDEGTKAIIKDKFLEERNSAPPIVAKNSKQKGYLKLLRDCQVIVAEGSAGVGKTYLASAISADKLRKGQIDKIIVARPYVVTGKTSGFKPGSSLEKLLPFVRTMLDTMKQRMGAAAFGIALKDGQSGEIEVQELESIRGRSFDEESVLIIDEAQQSTPEEIISILTRISDKCQLILCGDPHQKDIKGESGLEWFIKFAERHKLDIGHVRFTSDDIVRGGFVKDVIKGLEKDGYHK